MATTTASITLSSGDLTGDALALSASTTLTKAGTVTGLDQTTGVSRKTYTTSSICLLYTSPSPRDVEESRMPSSA